MTQIQIDEMKYQLTHEAGMTPMQAWLQVRLVETQLDLARWARETKLKNGIDNPLGELIH